VAEPRPQLLGEVGRDRRQQQRHRLARLAPRRRVAGGAGRLGLGHRVLQRHELGHRGVEAEALEVVGDPGDGLVDRAAELLQHGLVGGRRRGLAAAVAHDQRPHPVQEAGHALDALVVPGAALVPRADEHQVGADRVGAVGRDQVVGVGHVAPRLRHLLAVGAQDHPLVAQADEGLAPLHEAQVAEHLGEEAA
jgi:hypothetical protein